jgi:hypothetical protein
VGDAPDRPERLGPGGAALRRHRDALVPPEHATGSLQVGDLRQALTERAKLGFHER